MDAICLDDDGSVTDCVLLAVVCALKGLQLPALEYVKAIEGLRAMEKGEDFGDKEIKYPAKVLHLHGIPVPMSFGVFESTILLADPSSEEEKLTSTTFVTVGLLNGDSEKISVYKQGGSTVSIDILKQAFEISKLRINRVEKLLTDADSV